MRLIAATVVASLLTLAAIPFAPAAEAAAGEQSREYQGALWLRQEGRYEEAKAALLAWIDQHPADGQAYFDYSYTLYIESLAGRPAKTATELRKQSFAAAQKAKKLGNTDVMLDQVFLATDAIGADLRDITRYSANPEAAALIKEGEAAFSAKKLEEAMALYRRALALDPHSYMAALFIGDGFFYQNKYRDAVEWFAKASAIDPDREQAYRYSGDALLKLGKSKEARDQYIAAVVAAPYERIPREMLQRFAASLKIPLRPPAVVLPRVKVEMKEGKNTLTLPAPPPAGQPDDISVPAMLYGTARMQWLELKRAKYFPGNSSPRHSLPEECDALRSFIKVMNEMKEKKPEIVQRYAATIQTLQSLDKDGLLEAFVLLDRPDDGIAQDYAAYRLEHRAALQRYISTVWFAPAPPAKP